MKHFMSGKKGHKKRFWSDDEKREICRQTTVPGVSVAQVARRYAVNANLIFKWLKDRRFAPVSECIEEEVSTGDFLPVEIDADLPALVAPDAPVPSWSPPQSFSASRVDITLSDGRRILIEGPTALSAVLGLVQGLMV